MYAQLGEVAFDLITYFDGLEASRECTYAEHAVIEGKPKLQYTGDGLETLTINLVFHATYCTPEDEIKKLRDMMAQHKAQPLIFGDGTYKGRYVVTALTETARSTDSQGRLLDLVAKISLKEHVGGSDAPAGEAVDDGKPSRGALKLNQAAAGTQRVITGDLPWLHETVSPLGIASGAMTGAVNVLCRISELGRMTLPGIIGALPSVVAPAANLGLSGISGLASTGAALQLAAGARLDTPGAIGSVANFLRDLPGTETVAAFARLGVDAPAALRAAPHGDAVDAAGSLIAQTVGIAQSRYADLFADPQARDFARVLTAGLPLYRRVREISLASADRVPADSSLFGVSLKHILRVA
ncbi:MAG: phage tail protein [Desulfovibrionaceae bacterium]|nr:phage tail protein [Desulfovibrionaceae bacterium]MBF0513624.1 phage tail protein [Desulfovibrionaceae bacterium]